MSSPDLTLHVLADGEECAACEKMAEDPSIVSYYICEECGWHGISGLEDPASESDWIECYDCGAQAQWRNV